MRRKNRLLSLAIIAGLTLASTPAVAKPKPTLAEIESKGGNFRKKEVRNLDYVSTEEYDEEDLKRELMFKFELLKKDIGDLHNNNLMEIL